jgi:hypothetical protein
MKQYHVKFFIMPLWWYLIFFCRQPAPSVLIVINSHVITARYRARQICNVDFTEEPPGSTSGESR